MNSTCHSVRSGPQPWLAADLAASTAWIVQAPPALASFSPDALQTWLAPHRHQLLHGYGVVLIRGLSPQLESTFRRLYLDLGRCLGVPDTTYGELYDVTDRGLCHRSMAIPVSQTRASTSMHTDSSCLETHPRWVGLACVRQAPVGGGSRLASALAVHEHLQAVDPASLLRLKRWFYRDVVTPGVANPRALIANNQFPVFSDAADGPTLRYMRYWIEKGHERLGLPLADADRRAFDALDAALNHPRFCHSFQLQEGDILMVDNHKLVHDREAYEDTPLRPRHLIRLWLNEGGWRETS